MRTLFLLASLLVLGSGCEQLALVATPPPPPSPPPYALVADTKFARTSAGYINSGLLSNGQLYLWDKNSRTINYLAAVGVNSEQLSPVEPPANMTASNLHGIQVAGDATVPAMVRAQAELEIQRNALFQLSNFTAETLRDPTSMLNDYVNGTEPGEERDNRIGALLLKDAAGNDRYRFLFVVRVIRADQAAFVYNGQTAGEAVLSVPIALSSGTIGATVKVNHGVSFSGPRTPVLVNISVYRLVHQESPDGPVYRFALDPEASSATLSGELRQSM